MSRLRASTADIHTSDINFAAFLMITGAKLMSIFHQGRNCTWVFEHRPEVPDPYVDFLNNALVPAKDYAEAIRSCKRVAMNGASKRRD